MLVISAFFFTGSPGSQSWFGLRTATGYPTLDIALVLAVAALVWGFAAWFRRRAAAVAVEVSVYGPAGIAGDILPALEAAGRLAAPELRFRFRAQAVAGNRDRQFHASSLSPSNGGRFPRQRDFRKAVGTVPSGSSLSKRRHGGLRFSIVAADCAHDGTRDYGLRFAPSGAAEAGLPAPPLEYVRGIDWRRPGDGDPLLTAVLAAHSLVTSIDADAVAPGGAVNAGAKAWLQSLAPWLDSELAAEQSKLAPVRYSQRAATLLVMRVWLQGAIGLNGNDPAVIAAAAVSFGSLAGDRFLPLSGMERARCHAWQARCCLALEQRPDGLRRLGEGLAAAALATALADAGRDMQLWAGTRLLTGLLAQKLGTRLRDVDLLQQAAAAYADVEEAVHRGAALPAGDGCLDDMRCRARQALALCDEIEQAAMPSPVTFV